MNDDWNDGELLTKPKMLRIMEELQFACWYNVRNRRRDMFFLCSSTESTADFWIHQKVGFSWITGDDRDLFSD